MIFTAQVSKHWHVPVNWPKSVSYRL